MTSHPASRKPRCTRSTICGAWMARPSIHPSSRGTAEIVDAGVLRLQAGTHRAVEDEHALAQRVEERGSISGRHRDHVTRERLRDTLANRPISFEETLFGTTPTPSW